LYSFEKKYIDEQSYIPVINGEEIHVDFEAYGIGFKELEPGRILVVSTNDSNSDFVYTKHCPNYEEELELLMSGEPSRLDSCF